MQGLPADWSKVCFRCSILSGRRRGSSSSSVPAKSIAARLALEGAGGASWSSSGGCFGGQLSSSCCKSSLVAVAWSLQLLPAVCRTCIWIHTGTRASSSSSSGRLSRHPCSLLLLPASWQRHLLLLLGPGRAIAAAPAAGVACRLMLVLVLVLVHGCSPTPLQCSTSASG
jgi:hypothetical protein